MAIPTKIIINGNKVQGSAFIGDGHRQMLLLENLMEFQGLEQYSIRMSPQPGVTITATKVFGMRTVEITTGGGGSKKKEVNKSCLCTCDFTHGFITKIVETPLEDKIQGVNIPLYDIVACCKERFYKPFKNVLASDFTQYRPFQKVLVLPYFEMLYSCCDATNVATGCNPHVSEDDISEAGWRTPLRILPWCGIRLQQWERTE